MWQFITDLGDQAVTLPLALFTFLLLLAIRWRRGAWLWLAAVAISFGLIFVLKLLFAACTPHALLRSPSGHTMAATVVYGGWIGLAGAPAIAVLPAVLTIALAVGFSRVELGFHSAPDAIAGGAVGAVCALLLHRLAGPPPSVSGNTKLALLTGIICLASAALVLHGHRLHVEPWLHSMAVLNVRSLVGCKV